MPLSECCNYETCRSTVFPIGNFIGPKAKRIVCSGKLMVTLMCFVLYAVKVSILKLYYQ